MALTQKNKDIEQFKFSKNILPKKLLMAAQFSGAAIKGKISKVIYCFADVCCATSGS